MKKLSYKYISKPKKLDCLNFLKSQPEHDNCSPSQLTLCQDRGGLSYISVEFVTFVQKLEKLFNDMYNNKFCNIKED